jgi:hypothetical protein
MADATSPLRFCAARVRPAHLALAGALVVGWTAARAARPSRVADEPPVESSEGPTAELEPVVDPPAPHPRRRRLTRRVAMLTGTALVGLLLSGTGVSIGPGDALAPLVTPAQLARQARRAARQIRTDLQRAEATRLSALRHLQAEGIAGRGPGRSEVVVRSVARKPQVSSRAILPGAAASPLDRFVSALGPDLLLAGLQASRATLQEQVLKDPRIQIYPAGRADVASGRLDVRVLALLEYLADAHGSVTVSCLIAGHSRYVHGRPGVVSAHVYGRAVDLSAVGGVPILDNQGPGGITDQTVRELIALPSPLRPVQVISLLSLGGPSFALPDHYDHIHVGY